MAETSQDNYPSVEQEFVGGSRSRKRLSLSTKPKTSNDKIGARLLCDTWRIPNKRRVQIGFVGLAFVVPFISLTLVHPEWTGHIGSRLSLGLFSLLGQGALLIPLCALYLVLSCAGFRPLRRTRYAFLVPLTIVSLLLIERWAQSGGWLGRLLDRVVLAALGPGGAWLITITLFCMTLAAFIPKIKEEAGQLASMTLEYIRDTRLRLRNGWLNLVGGSKEKSADAAVSAETATETTAPNVLPLSTQEPSKPVIIDHFQENVEEVVAPDVPEPPAAPVMAIAPQQPVMDVAPQLPVASEEDVEPTAVEPDAAAPVYQDENVVRYADSSEIEESLELQKPKLTNSDEAEAVVPRARTFELPPLVLLDDVPYSERRPPTEDKSQALLDALDAFGVKAKLLQIVRGPTVTRYELQPARGVKVSKFTSLTNDIALALASTAVRIEAPIPGKSAIGIEIPNKHTDLVVLKDILRDTVFTDSKGLTVALGKDLSGRPVVTDLQKMPHLLVAGTTGSGKSVCVNGLIISLLYRFTPDQLQLMMVDPKQVELSVYEDIPHLVGFTESDGGEIIVDPKKAAQALHQVVGLMEERYKLFADNKVRNLAEYNQKFPDDQLPWFVVIIDELADLMMVASKSVETSICRIAQKARAAGIHLVLATQRPSADVITGLIKVNIPSRAAFAVSSGVDSRVILDSNGAEHLLGKGDMLFMPVDASDPKRLQGSYVGNEEIARVVEFWKGQGLPENRIEFELQEDILAADDDDGDDDSDDALLQEALRAMLERKQASASMLQTQLKVGYARARRLLIAMERKGWVGPPEGSKPRKILYSGPPPGDGTDFE
ncbi:MAG: DNA translocase FtsK 4TM domain-containing protein [Candidatus Eremiobacteraeota bacterium]|nr:DNA translocase FtsK 4TM domain-containing protein [Candidatus Eremiobacteraeota bacterium]